MGTMTKEEILEKLPVSIREKASVSMSYQLYLQTINSHLKTIYGDYADWSKCLNSYFLSQEYKKHCHYVKRSEDIPVLSREELNKMLCEEVNYSIRIKQLWSESTNKAGIKEEFGNMRIDKVKLSDAKGWLIKLQSDGRGGIVPFIQ